MQTPDPRREDPPEGTRLLLAWDFPKKWFSQELLLEVTVRFWDHREEVFSLSVEKKRGVEAIFFPKQEGKILTYKVDLCGENGVVLDTWRHHFWTERL